VSETDLTERIRELAPTRDDSDWTEVVARARATVSASPESRRLPALRRVLATAFAGAVLVLAIVLIPAWLGGDERVSLVDRALAAVSGGPVLHAVLEIETEKTVIGSGPARRFTVVDLATGRERPVETRIELWYDPERNLLHSVGSIDGVVQSDALHTTRSRPTSEPPALAAFFRGYRQALADGSATRAGSDVVEGQRVEWLRFPVAGSEGVGQEVALAESSDEALYLRGFCSRCTAKPPMYRIARLEGVSTDAADFSPPDAPKESRKGRYASGGRRTIGLGEAESRLGRPALWAGRRVNGVDFSHVQYVYGARHTSLPTTRENEVGRGHGLLLIYGADLEAEGRWQIGADGTWQLVHEKPYVSITETADYRYGPGNFLTHYAERPLTVAGAPVPPPGQVALSGMGPNAGWLAQLEKNGLYVEIHASSRELALAAAGALEPVRPRG
jgi:hypothetical protein